MGKCLVEGYSKLKTARKALADIPKWSKNVVPDAGAVKKANTAAEQARSAASQSRTVASRTSKEVDSAKKANAQAKKQAENKKSSSCETNSFVPGTGVLMADGSVKAIDDVAVGDTVVAVAADGARKHRQEARQRAVERGWLVVIPPLTRGFGPPAAGLPHWAYRRR